MKKLLLLIAVAALARVPLAAAADDGFTNMFDGKSLAGWDGCPDLWSVHDGVIVGKTTMEHPAKENTFLIWTNGKPSDFEMRCSFRIHADNDVGFANSGVQFRSKVVKPEYWVVSGYQADMEAGPNYTGGLYEEKARGILSARGQKVTIHPDGSKEVTGSVGDKAALENEIRKGEWNDYGIVAKGNHISLSINGKPMGEITDDQADKAATWGVIALQLHAGKPMTVEFKDLRLKMLQ